MLAMRKWCSMFSSITLEVLKDTVKHFETGFSFDGKTRMRKLRIMVRFLSI